MNEEFFFQLYICFDAFAPLPEQYSNIHVSFYFWLLNKDHKSYFNVSTVRAWDRKDANKIWLSTHIISFLPFEFNHKGAYNPHWVLPTVANHYIIINTISVHCIALWLLVWKFNKVQNGWKIHYWGLSNQQSADLNTFKGCLLLILRRGITLT